MGREIRKVPANWDHPKRQMAYGFDYAPMNDENYEEAKSEWDRDKELWDKGTHPDLLDGAAKKEDTTFEEWHGEAPDPAYYRPYKDEECTHFQMYQTVSEGTPVTPVFATLEQLEDYLVETGECAGTKYNKKFSRAAAHNFCQSGYAPSMIISRETGVMDGVSACEFTGK